jgi:hypothetical protein
VSIVSTIYRAGAKKTQDAHPIAVQADQALGMQVSLQPYEAQAIVKNP